MRVNTPGPLGYFTAMVVAFAWNAFFIGALQVEEGVSGVLAVTVLAFFFHSGYGPFVAVPGILIVHVCCRAVRAQWVHVLAAGSVGGIAGAAVGTFLEMPALTLMVGVSAALGRLAVVPSVHRRQERFASHPPLRVP